MVRLKHRYLLVNILYPDSSTDAISTRGEAVDDLPYTVRFHRPTSDRVDARSLAQAIRHGVAELFGDYGAGMTGASLQVKYFSSATSTAIIRVSRDHYRLVWAALTFTLQLPKPVSQPCVMQVVRVSGTIKKAEEEAIRRARLSIRKAQRVASGQGGLTAGDGDGPRAGARGDGLDGVEPDDGFAYGIEDADDLDDDDESD